jgi:SM-20-related protein
MKPPPAMKPMTTYQTFGQLPYASNFRHGPAMPDFSKSDIMVYDDLLDKASQRDILTFLLAAGWAFGGFSDPLNATCRYWYKHFAGYIKHDRERGAADDFEIELKQNAPLLAEMWKLLQTKVMAKHALIRCYANGYPYGAEGGLHVDASGPGHYTGIYYPHFAWHANYGGETVFFNRNGTDIIASIYPRPNRFVVFPGFIPHIARGISSKCPEIRITLMFKTL